MSTEPTIHLLSPKVSNLIAAGEVVLRPASVVKELMENAIDAAATKISLVVSKGGTELIQVNDDGKGMSYTDLALAFERHATSKVREVEDLDTIATKGFRGEALASIAAVSMVEVVTKREHDDTGACLEIADATVSKHEFCAANQGTQFKVKNLFYNTPARRKFLKSESIEFKHIAEEFLRLALVHSDIHFSLKHNGKIIHDLYPSTYKQRIIRAFGQKIDGNLIKVEDQTKIVKISGFVSQTTYYRKYRGEQYFFVNKRFIKHSLFHHAVISSYEGLIPEKQIPSYFLHLEVDSKEIDINVHPQKTEVLFENERIIYEMIKTVIKKALGHFQVDLNWESAPTQHVTSQSGPITAPRIDIDQTYNPFESKSTPSTHTSTKVDSTSFDQWQQEKMNIAVPNQQALHSVETDVHLPMQSAYIHPPIQWQRHYILLIGEHQIKLIHLRRLYTEMVYRQLTNQKHNGSNAILGVSQRLIFDLAISLSNTELSYLEGIQDRLFELGFDWTIDTNLSQLKIHAKPAAVTEIKIKEYIEALVSFDEDATDFDSQLLQSVARQMPLSIEPRMSQEMLQSWVELVDQEHIQYRFDGKPISKTLASSLELNQTF